MKTYFRLTRKSGIWNWDLTIKSPQKPKGNKENVKFTSCLYTAKQCM